MKDNLIIRRIEIVAKALGDLKTQMVFVGGATVSLYTVASDDEEIRPTKDIDCIVKLSNYSDIPDFEIKLHGLGFINVREPNAPLCRYSYEDIIVDIMPHEGSVWGFSNRWYPAGLENSRDVLLPGGTIIRILEWPYFIATKLEAYHDRGAKDPVLSHDLQDIVTVLAGLVDYNAIEFLKADIRNYLADNFRDWRRSGFIYNYLEGEFPPTNDGCKKIDKIIQFIERF